MTGSTALRGLHLLTAVVLVLACTDQSTQLAEHLAAAEAFRAEQKLNEAQLELASALRLDPQNADTNIRLARLEAAAGRPDDALFHFEEAYRLDPGNVDAAAGIVGIVSFSDLERAQAVVAEAREQHPSDPRVHMAAASVALVEGDTTAALVAALTAVELGPELAAAHLQLGLVRVAEIRRRGLEKEPISEDLFSEAVTAFKKARELSSGKEAIGARLRGWLEEARVYARWPKHGEQMRSTLAEALEDLHDTPDATRRGLVKMSLDLGRQKRDQELIQWALERTVEIDPQHYKAWGDLALLAQRKEGSGVEVVERLIAERPDDARAHAIYARMLDQTGATQEAVAHLKKIAPKLEGDTSPLLQRLVELQIRLPDIEAARATQAEMVARYPEAGSTYHASAQLASAEGDLTSAVDWLTRWRDQNENLVALRMLSTTELARGNPSAALAAADRALELARQEGARLRPFLCLRGQSLMRLGEHTTALQVLAKARRAPGVPSAGCREAFVDALYAAGRDELALESLEPMLAKTPSREAVLLFARREGARDPERARALLEAYVATQPGDTAAQRRLVQMDLAAGQPEAALARARAAVATHPDSPRMNLMLGRTLASTGQIDEAVESLERTLERWPSAPGTSAALLQLLGRLGRMDEAREALEKLNAAGQLPPGSQVMLARIRTRSGDDEGAREMLEAALETDPDLTAAANDLAYLLARRGEDLERATELAQVARGQVPDSAQIADTLGWVFHLRGLSNAALVQFDDAIDLADPQSSAWATANYHRALALAQLDRKEEALTAMERALASGADFPEAEDARTAIQDLSKSTS